MLQREVLPVAGGLFLMVRVGQDRMYTPYMTVYLVVSLLKLPYIHRIYMVLATLLIIASQNETLCTRHTGLACCSPKER
jgi:hypothetical protein